MIGCLSGIRHSKILVLDNKKMQVIFEITQNIENTRRNERGRRKPFTIFDFFSLFFLLQKVEFTHGNISIITDKDILFKHRIVRRCFCLVLISTGERLHQNKDLKVNCKERSLKCKRNIAISLILIVADFIHLNVIFWLFGWCYLDGVFCWIFHDVLE